MTGPSDIGLMLKPAPLKTDVAVEIVGMHKWFAEFHVLRDINLKVTRGERIVICGHRRDFPDSGNARPWPANLS